jgi:hypothetical protein
VLAVARIQEQLQAGTGDSNVATLLGELGFPPDLRKRGF